MKKTKLENLLFYLVLNHIEKYGLEDAVCWLYETDHNYKLIAELVDISEDKVKTILEKNGY